MARAENKKISTAVKDLMLKRGSPHNPCPLVQPLDSLVPKPTRNPASPYPIYEVVAVMDSADPKGVNMLKVPY